MVIILYISISLLFALGIFLLKNNLSNYIFISLFLVLQWGFSFYEYSHLNEIQLTYFNPDSFGIILLFVLTVICTTSFYYSIIYFKHNNDSPRAVSLYYSALILLIMALSCAYLGNHIAIVWIFIEITTLSSSVLIYHTRTGKALEATWKYVFISSVSLALIFVGILFLSLATKEAKIGNMFYSDLLKNALKLDEFWVKATFLFVFTGFTVKAGLAPMYTVGIDAKDKSPSPASALLSSVVMNAGFIGIFRLYEIVYNTNVRSWAVMVMIISGITSVFIAAAYMVRVKSYKRMFAYSSVEHMGLIILGIASGGIGFLGAILHLILHSFSKAAMFYQTGSIFRVIKSKFIKDAGNYFENNLFGSLVLILGFFIITAIPPSGMFITEFLIFRSLFEASLLWILIIIGILLSFIIWSMGDSIFKLLFRHHNNEDNPKPEKIKFYETLPQLLLLLAVIYLGFNPPQVLMTLIQQALINLK